MSMTEREKAIVDAIASTVKERLTEVEQRIGALSLAVNSQGDGQANGPILNVQPAQITNNVPVPSVTVTNEVNPPSIDVHNEMATPAVNVVVDTRPIADAIGRMQAAITSLMAEHTEMIAQLVRGLTESAPPVVRVKVPNNRPSRKVTFEHDADGKPIAATIEDAG